MRTLRQSARQQNQAGIIQHVFRGQGEDGRALEMITATAILVAGTNTVQIDAHAPGAGALAGWYIVGYARITAGAGALGDLTVSISAAGLLTILSSAGTDVSTVRVLLARGGAA